MTGEEFLRDVCNDCRVELVGVVSGIAILQSEKTCTLVTVPRTSKMMHLTAVEKVMKAIYGRPSRERFNVNPSHMKEELSRLSPPREASL